MRRLERQTVAEYGLDIEEERTPIHLLDGFIGEGYAIPYPDEVETIRLVARTEGLLLDPVYTGKALYGLAQAAGEDDALAGKRVLFVHTGGLPGLLAQGEELESVL